MVIQNKNGLLPYSMRVVSCIEMVQETLLYETVIQRERSFEAWMSPLQVYRAVETTVGNVTAESSVDFNCVNNC